MLRDLAALDPTFAYPVVIIGAGAAGLTLASRLDKAGVRVLLAESGGFEHEAEVQDMYAGEVRGLPYDLTTSRLRYFGGTTNHWAGQSDSLDAHTLAYRDWVPYSGWPIDHQELAAYYPEAFEICNLGPYGRDADIRRAFGRPFPPPTAAIAPRVFHSSRPIVRFGDAYRQRIVESDNVDLVLHATAVELLTDPAGERVTHVHFRNLKGESVKQAARFVVVACGGIENPRLLLASNSARPAGLGNEHDLVGRFFMEHPHFAPFQMFLGEGTDIASTGWTELAELGATAMTVLDCTPATQARERMLHFGLFLFNRSQPPHDGLLAQPAARAAYEGTWAGARGHDRFTGGYVITEQAPNPDSRVTLTDERDALGMPRLALDWRLGDLDRHTLVKGAETVARELTRAGLARVRIKPWVHDSEGLPPDKVDYGNHHMGTTRMSETPLTGVVDRDGRVHSVPNLYIAGSSVFPTSGLSNPTVNIVALALRLAGHLQARVAEAARLTGRKYRLGAPIDFTSAGRGRRFLAGGWSYPEPSGTWTGARTARMAFELVDRPRDDLVLVLTAHPFVVEGGPESQEVRVIAAGRRLARLTLDRPDFREYRIPIPRDVAADGRLELRLEVPRAASPLALGVSGDGRVLGVKLRNAVIEPESAS